MAQRKSDTQDTTAPQAGAEITQTAEDSPGGVNTRQVEPTRDRSDKDLKADMTHPEDVEVGALQEPEHEADKSPYPVQEQPPLERPPFATARPDVPIVSSAIKGAGEHTPPPPEDFTPDGRPRMKGIND